jgi:hypothetical protein
LGGLCRNFQLSSACFRINGVATGDIAGYSVSSAGDVNGDGFDDIVVGAPNADPNGSSSGASYVVFGHASGFPTSFEPSTLNGANGFKISGESGSGNAGRSVASAGDVNNDGIDDLIVGASGGGALSAYVVFGTRSGFAANLQLSALDGSNGFQFNLATSLAGRSVDSAGDINGDGFDDVIVGAPFGSSAYVVFGGAAFAANLSAAGLNGSNGFRLSGPADLSGWSVAGAGDVNGDGYDDVIVGAPKNAPNGTQPGASYVVFGKATGFSGNIDLAALDGWNGFKLNGVAVADGTGLSVAAAGDINADGLADLIIGAQYVHNGSSSGEIYVVFGQRSFSAAFNLSSLDGANGFKLSGPSNIGTSVSSAGDVDGDGFDDVIVGSGYGGASYVVYGKAGGFASSLNLSSLSGTDGFKLLGPDARTESVVSSAGDVNGDGLDDLVVGTPLADVHGTDSGASYVIFGRASAPAPDSIVKDTSTTAVLTVDGAVSGRIDILDLSGSDPDVDWYQVTLTANQAYRFTPNARTGTLDVLSMRVYSDDTTAASAVADNSTFLDFTPTVSAIYYLAVAAGGVGAAAKTGNYSVILSGPGAPTVDTVANDAGTAATLAVGGSISGTIDLSDLDGGVPDADWYKVTLIAGHRYGFTPASGSGTLDVVALRLFGGDGTTPVTALADNSTPFDFRPTSSGDYFLSVGAGGTGAASKSGDFQVSLTDYGTAADFVANDISTTTTLAVGGTISGTIDDRDFDGSVPDRDWYKLTLIEDHEYLFTVTNRTGTLDLMELGFYNALGIPRTMSFDVDTTLQVILGRETTYVSVSAGGSGTGRYGDFTISLEDLYDPGPDTVPDNPATLEILAVGGTISGTIDFKDFDGSVPDKDWYKVTLTAGHQYLFTPGGGTGTLDVLALRLFDGTTPATAIADNDTVLDFTPTTSGIYFLSVAAGGSGAAGKTGDFTVSLVDIGVATDAIPRNTTTTAMLQVGGSANGAIESQDISGSAPDEDWFKVTLTANHTYTFGYGGSGAPSKVGRVYTDDVTAATDPSTFSSLVFTPSASGTYYFSIKAGGIGSYAVTLTDNGVTDVVPNDTGTTATLAVNGSVAGKVDPVDQDGTRPDQDWYRVSLAADKEYTITSGAGIAVRLYHADGTPASAPTDGAAALKFIPTASGTYYVAAGGTDPTQQNLVDYTLSLRQNAAPTFNVSYDESTASLPSGLVTAFAKAVEFVQDRFDDTANINLHIGYGHVGDFDLDVGSLGAAYYFLNRYDVLQIRNAYVADGKTADDALAIAHMPASDPTGYNNYYLTKAQAAALGLLAPGNSIDIYIGFDDTPGRFDYDPSDGIGAGLYDFFGVAVHEITHGMGRTDGLGKGLYQWEPNPEQLCAARSVPIREWRSQFRSGSERLLLHRRQPDQLHLQHDCARRSERLGLERRRRLLPVIQSFRPGECGLRDGFAADGRDRLGPHHRQYRADLYRIVEC